MNNLLNKPNPDDFKTPELFKAYECELMGAFPRSRPPNPEDFKTEQGYKAWYALWFEMELENTEKN
jgi:hypothetical protein